MNTESQRTRPSCGNEFSGAMEFCPVCMLRKALADRGESGESSFEEAVKPTLEQAVQRFEHYELVTGEDRKPVELGRGAMGVTYKAFSFAETAVEGQSLTAEDQLFILMQAAAYLTARELGSTIQRAR